MIVNIIIGDVEMENDLGFKFREEERAYKRALRKKRREEMIENINSIQDPEQRELEQKKLDAEDRMWSTFYETEVGGYIVKSGIPVIIGKLDWEHADRFYYDYNVLGLDHECQEWQWEEYEKLNKKAYNLIVRYLRHYLYNGYKRDYEKIKEETLNNIYYRMLFLTRKDCKNITFDEYINMDDEDFIEIGEGLVYPHILHEFFLTDFLGVHMELWRKERMNWGYLFGKPVA